jgi:hypothetical protein
MAHFEDAVQVDRNPVLDPHLVLPGQKLIHANGPGLFGPALDPVTNSYIFLQRTRTAETDARLIGFKE